MKSKTEHRLMSEGPAVDSSCTHLSDGFTSSVCNSDKPVHSSHDREIDGMHGPWMCAAPCFPK